MKKLIYDSYIVKMIVSVYGVSSEIYLQMMEGKQISSMIKTDIKKKGKASWKRITDKKMLFKLCKETEEKILKTEVSV